MNGSTGRRCPPHSHTYTYIHTEYDSLNGQASPVNKLLFRWKEFIVDKTPNGDLYSNSHRMVSNQEIN